MQTVNEPVSLPRGEDPSRKRRGVSPHTGSEKSSNSRNNKQQQQFTTPSGDDCEEVELKKLVSGPFSHPCAVQASVAGHQGQVSAALPITLAE